MIHQEEGLQDFSKMLKLFSQFLIDMKKVMLSICASNSYIVWTVVLNILSSCILSF